MIRVPSKAIAIDLIGYIMIGLVAIILLLIFIAGPLKDLSRGTFCFFYVNILQQSADFCPSKSHGPVEESISPQTTEDYAREIAAKAAACHEEKIEPTNFTTCSILNINSFPGKITESDVTRILEKDPGNACGIIQNSKVVLENGTVVPYQGNCGGEDDILWDVSNNVLTDQSVVVIRNDIVAKKIVVRA